MYPKIPLGRLVFMTSCRAQRPGKKMLVNISQYVGTRYCQIHTLASLYGGEISVQCLN